MIGGSEQTHYRWHREFRGMKVDQARRFKKLKKKNARLKRLLVNAEMDEAILP